jgi:type I restriction enzyme S subunit
MSELYQLPDGWKWREWDGIVDIKNGKHYKDVINPNGKYPIYGSGGVINFADEYLCNENSVIIGRKGTINNPIFVKEKFWNIDTAFGLEANKSLLVPMFLYYFAQNFNFLDLNTATTMPSLTKSNLQKIKMPLPLIPEQKRIVQKLDALFERIDKAIALLQKNIDAVDNFMNSVLNDVFSNLEQNYSSKLVKSFANVGTGVTPLKTNKTYYNDGTISWITSKSTGHPFVNEADELITEIALKECRLVLNPIGTLIVALYGQGKTRGQVSELLIEAATNQAVATILVDGSKCINKYLKWYFKKSYLELREKSNGGTQQNLNLSIIKNTVVPLPDDLSIQLKIVAYLDEVSAQIEQVKSAQQQKMQNLLNLKSSILDQAFHGKL